MGICGTHTSMSNLRRHPRHSAGIEVRLGRVRLYCEYGPSFYQVLRVRQLPVVQVHVALGRRNVGVPQ
jgi:hypothetical protein